MSEFMILDGRVVTTRYTIDDSPDAQTGANRAISLDRWVALHRAGDPLEQTGVILEGDSDLKALKPLLDSLPFVAVSFPKFADGRGYSHARRLRALWGYAGPIIAFGDVLRDQLLYMRRCGINGFLLRDDQDPHACLAAFSLYSTHYQYDPTTPT